jgi:DNA ligase (NAD+)
MKSAVASLRNALIGVCLLALAHVVCAQALTHEQTVRRIGELQTEIARHDDLYFRKAAPEISDAEYDALKRELHALHEQFPAAASQVGSFFNTIGDDRTGRLPTARHLAPMLGLEKCYTEGELRKFLKRVIRAVPAGGSDVTWIIEPKYDGLAISLTYERGRLVRAVTRGNGEEGDLVTEMLLATTDIPVLLEEPGVPELVELRGEVFMELAEFERINAMRISAGDDVYAHPRNLAVGTLKSVEPSEATVRRLALVVFGWGEWQPKTTSPTSQQDFLRRCEAWGLATPKSHVVRGEETVCSIVRAMERGRLEFSAPIDGVVVKVDEGSLRDRLGESRTAPRWATAFKFEPERVETRLRAITLQVGRTGVVTPVAELEPVTIGGVTVSRATLHNRREVERRDYRVGDLVRLERAGDVIPHLVGVNLSARPDGAARYEFPSACTSCGTTFLRERESGLRCPNRSCPAQIKRRIEHLASDAALNIRGLGPALAAHLVDGGLVQDIDDLFRREVELPARLRQQVEQSRSADWWRWLAGLGLPEVGTANARKLAARFAGWEELACAGISELREAGLTEASARVLAGELQRESTQRLIRSLASLGVQPWRERSVEAMVGRTFAFAGSLRGINRAEAERRVRAAGGRVQGVVTQGIDYLVSGEDGGPRLEEARLFGVTVLSEDEFFALLSQP